MKKAIITGITGQDGAYLAEFLLNKGYEVHGMRRRSSSSNTGRIDHLIDNPNIYEKTLFLHHGDMTDSGRIYNILAKINPTEIYNLAAQSHVHVSFDIPGFTSETNAVGVLRILEAVRTLNKIKPVKFYQASTSEMFGQVQEIPQKETTAFYPRSPYGVAKLFGHWITVNYRESYNLFGCSGILFNHEGIRRGEEYVTRKITKGVAKIKHSLLNKTEFSALELGNINSYRDWSDASDFVDGIWKMMTQIKPSEYVLSSGETHSIKEFIDLSFKYADINGSWHGTGQGEEFSISVNDFHKYMPNQSVLVKINPIFYRPAEVDILLGNNTKAKKELGWDPKTTFKQLVEKMIKNDLSLLGI